jgi:16S rRNA (guanine527-N7)-methyltransferase
VNLLKETLEALGLYSPEILHTFQVYAQLLAETNKIHNLTSIKEEDTELLHFVDSILPLKFYEIPNGAKVIDLGSGAGFPGLPIKIVRPDIELTLVDARQKKVNFLNDVISKLGLKDVVAIHGRIESLCNDSKMKRKFDVVCTRALSATKNLIAMTEPYLSKNGVAIFWKGPSLNEEIQAAKNIIAAHKLKIKFVNEYYLPGDRAEGRTILVLELESQL